MNKILLFGLGAIVLTSLPAQILSVPSAQKRIVPSSQKRAVPSHCKADEQVVFSCTTTKAKVISLCSSSVLTSDSGYLQYRSGTAKKQELVYPATYEHPKKHFLSGTQMYSGGGSAFLKFSTGDHTYIVFGGIGRGWEKDGVVIQKAGKQIAYLPCKGALISEFGPDMFEKVKIPTDPNEREFEIP